VDIAAAPVNGKCGDVLAQFPVTGEGDLFAQLRRPLRRRRRGGSVCGRGRSARGRRGFPVHSACGDHLPGEPLIPTFSGILAYTEHIFGLAPLGKNDAQAYDFHNAFNYSQAPLAPVRMVMRPLPPSAKRIRITPDLANDPS